MFRINKLQIIGCLVKEPEYPPMMGELELAKFTISVPVIKQTRFSGGVEEYSVFDVEAWGRLVEIMRKTAQKGTWFYIEGKIKQSSWQDKNTGQTRTKIVIVAGDVQVVERNVEPPPKANLDAIFSPNSASQPTSGNNYHNGTSYQNSPVNAPNNNQAKSPQPSQPVAENVPANCWAPPVGSEPPF